MICLSNMAFSRGQVRVLEAKKQKHKKMKIIRNTPSGSVVDELERSQCLKVKSGHTLDTVTQIMLKNLENKTSSQLRGSLWRIQVLPLRSTVTLDDQSKFGKRKRGERLETEKNWKRLERCMIGNCSKRPQMTTEGTYDFRSPRQS